MGLALIDLKPRLLLKVKEALANSRPSGIHIISVPIEALDICRLGEYIRSYPKTYWQNRDHDLEILGLGQASYLPFSQFYAEKDFPRFSLNNLPLPWIGAFPFDLHAKLERPWESHQAQGLVLPRLAVIREKEQYFVRVYLNWINLQTKLTQVQFLFALERDLSLVHPRKAIKLTQREKEQPNRASWIDLVNRAKNRMNNQQFKKVVCARQLIYKHDSLGDPYQYLRDKSGSLKSTYIFYSETQGHKSFMSFSPERLFSIKENILKADALAGTCAKHEHDPKISAATLLNDKKERAEHEYVVKELDEVFSQLSDHIERPSTPNIMSLKFLQHLHTPFRAQIDHLYHPAKYLKLFHPTPAVGGRPWSRAKTWLEQNEPWKRGLYAGPMGVIYGDWYEFAVAIRSALVTNDKAYFFAGAGIVEDSIAEKEWDETSLKMSQFIQPSAQEEFSEHP